jgi:Zn-dependent protease
MSWSVVAVGLVGSWLLATDVFPRIDEDLSLRSRLMLAGGGVVFFLGSILAHEFGHALVARRHQIQTSSIRLWIFGGVAALSSPARTPSAEFQIAIAGPGTNAVLASLFMGIAALGRQLGAPEAILIVAVGLAILNLLLTVTNLVPAAPLDGGKVLASILWARTGRPEWARLISARSGLVAGLVVISYGLYELFLLDRISGFYTGSIGVFIFFAARADVVSASIRSRLAKTTVREILWHYPPAVHDSASLIDLERHLGPEAVSVPVQRWEHQTIGYLSTAVLSDIPTAHHSWTSVGQVMTPTEFVPAAWTSESLLAALERIGPEPVQMVGIDPETGAVVGTATPRQFAHLMRQPRLWGCA